jgi:hypothetical protein
MKKTIILASFILGMLLLIYPQSLLADGVMIVPTPDKSWSLVQEGSQNALILYNEGREEMLLNVNASGDLANAVWVFPIPAKPDDIDIDIVTSKQKLEGDLVGRKMANTFEDMALYHIDPTIFIAKTLPISGSAIMSGAIGFDGGNGVTVHEVVQKKGLISEVISTTDAASLNSYLESRGINSNEDTIKLFDEYIGKDFSFVASHVTDAELAKEAGLNMKIIFKTQKLYFPLKLTSAYGDRTMPISIQVLGHVSPKVFWGIRKYTEVNYYYLEDYSGFYGRFRADNDYQNVELGSADGFTSITIKAPAKTFTDDLWISNSAPLRIAFAKAYDSSPSIFSTIIYFFFSLLAAIIAGAIFLRKTSVLRLLMLGLFNFLAMPFVAYKTLTLKTKEVDEETGELLKKVSKKFIILRRISLIFLLLGIFIIIRLLIFNPIVEEVFAALIDPANRPKDIPFDVYESNARIIRKLMLVLQPPILAVEFLIISLLFRLRGREAGKLFKQLRSHGISMYTFVPKDINKLNFIVAFSIVFLALTYLITHIT